MKHKLEHWRRGVTLRTIHTSKLSANAIERNDKVEKAMIFSSFSNEDLGRSRELVCRMNEFHDDYEYNARLIAAAPELLATLIVARDILDEKGVDTIAVTKLIKKIQEDTV